MNDFNRLVGMAMARAMTVAAATVALAGCSGGEPDKAPETDAAATQNRELLEAVQQPLDRAREVEDISGARKGELDRELEAAE